VQGAFHVVFIPIRAAVPTVAFLLALCGAGVAQSVPAANPVPAVAPAAGNAVLVLGGTPLKIALTTAIASNTAHSGDPFQFKALDNLVVDGWIVVAKGALGEGQVMTAESAGGNGHPGKLTLRFDWVYGVDAMKVALSDVPSQQNGEDKKGAASTATIATYVLLGPLGLFAHNFVRGQNVIVKTDQTIPVYVADSVHVTSNVQVTAAAGFAH
jgi:hypothetical protein